MKESCRSYEWVKSLCVVTCSGVIHRFVVGLFCQNKGSFVGEKDVCTFQTYISCVKSESCLWYEWIMSHIWMSHVSDMNESCHTYEWVMSHIWMSHVSHMNESCRSCEWVKSLCVVMCSGVLHRFVVCLFCQNIGLFCQNVGLFRQNIGLFPQSRSSHSRRRWWYFRLKPFKKKNESYILIKQLNVLKKEARDEVNAEWAFSSQM